MGALETSFGPPVPSDAAIKEFLIMFENWLGVFANNILHVHSPDSPLVRQTIQNNLIFLCFSVPSTSTPHILTSVSLESIVVRPTGRGRGIGKQICNSLLQVFVIQHGFTLDVPLALDITTHLFRRLVADQPHSLVYTEIERQEAAGLFIQEKGGHFTGIRITSKTGKKRAHDRRWVNNGRPILVPDCTLALARAELAFFCTPPRTILPRRYLLCVFAALAQDIALISEMDDCISLLSLHGFEALLSDFPWLLTHYDNTKQHPHHADYLMKYDASFSSDLKKHLQTPWLYHAPTINKPLSMMLALLLLMGASPTDTPEDFFLEALFVWDCIFDQPLPKHHQVISLVRPLLFSSAAPMHVRRSGVPSMLELLPE